MSPQELSLKASPVKILSFKTPSLKGLSLKGMALKNLKLPALSFGDVSLKELSLGSAKPQSVQAEPGRAWAAHLSSPRTRITVLSAAVVAMAALATGGMVMGPPIEPVRMSGLNAVKTEGYPVFDRYGEPVGQIASVENADGRTMWLNIKLEDGNMARVASFRGFLDARARQVDLVLTRDLLETRGIEQANAAADQAAFKAVMEDGQSDPVTKAAKPT
ncbi:MAG TPA: hypothetical protein VGO52_24645 [Hyphomonadaceae bacterium]|jgi:hypothetical protein|nr:hypothetical protein [Hyphomonadaceae bacterium]